MERSWRIRQRVSPATVNDADQLPFFTVIPHSQFHLAQRPSRSLKGTVERWRSAWEEVVPREPVAHPLYAYSCLPVSIFLSQPFTCPHVLGAAGALGPRR